MLYKNTEISRYLQLILKFRIRHFVVNAVQKYRDFSVFTTYETIKEYYYGVVNAVQKYRDFSVFTTEGHEHR
ncbi:MAG: hypothetical protein NZ455_17005 [Bacteroidia bacterium]|nr:hypothetical protein [Bacteroidia bacterium]